MNDPKNNVRCQPQQLSRLLDGELDEEALQDVRAHLDSCPACRQALEVQQIVSKRFQAAVTAEQARIDFKVLERRILMRRVRSGSFFPAGLLRFIALKRFYIPLASAATALVLFLMVYSPFAPPMPSAIVTSFSGDISAVMIMETPKTHQTILWFNEKQVINENEYTL